MIPAKDKAKELVNKFLQIYDGRVPQAKQCTLICVDEMIKYGDKRGLNWLRDVKQEIEKL